MRAVDEARPVAIVLVGASDLDVAQRSGCEPFHTPVFRCQADIPCLGEGGVMASIKKAAHVVHLLEEEAPLRAATASASPTIFTQVKICLRQMKDRTAPPQRALVHRAGGFVDYRYIDQLVRGDSVAVPRQDVKVVWMGVEIPEDLQDQRDGPVLAGLPLVSSSECKDIISDSK